MVAETGVVSLRVVGPIVSPTALKSLQGTFQNNASNDQKIGCLHLLQRSCWVGLPVSLHRIKHCQSLFESVLASDDSSAKPCRITDHKAGAFRTARHPHGVRCLKAWSDSHISGFLH